MSLSYLLSLSLPVLLAKATCAASGPVTSLDLINKVIAPDGFSRSAVLPNGTFPGPLITGNKGDNFLINVTDSLNDTTMTVDATVHWHGLFQHSTNWADGVPSVTQCPLIPGESFLYNFTAVNQAGTYWYHSHLQTQYCDGLRGPLVVYDSDDPQKDLYDVDDESTVLTLADWYHPVSSLLTPPENQNATLFNGLGRYPLGPTSDLAVINVEPGKRYRIRLVSISCDPNYVFSIDGHNMTIIEVDGVNHQPLVVDSIQIFAGQRYSFVLEANQNVSNYWFRATPSCAPGCPGGFENGINSAILRYQGAPDQEPTSTQTPSVIALNETNLHPLDNATVPGNPWSGGVDKAYNMMIDTLANGNFTVNNASFVGPQIPILLQILNGVPPQDLVPADSLYSLPANSSIEISFPMTEAAVMAGSPHPMHLHGHNFWVVRSAGATQPSYDNPVRRDVVSIGNSTNDNVTIRFETNNPGPWFLHCHIDFHLKAGFAVVLAEDIPDIRPTIDPSAAWDNLCPTYYDSGTMETTLNYEQP